MRYIESACLTPRQLQVAIAVVGGKTNKQIGLELHISPHTVKEHLTNLMRLFEVTSRTQLAATLLMARIQ